MLALFLHLYRIDTLFIPYSYPIDTLLKSLTAQGETGASGTAQRAAQRTGVLLAFHIQI
jgi:hypothetical protein